MRKLGLAAIALVLIGTAVAFIFQARIGTWLVGRAARDLVGRDALAGLDDGLHVALCGTGSPMPNIDRAGPCTVVIAGKQVVLVDIGEGGGRNLNVMGINPARLNALLLTHFHSDHIDGLGPLMLFHWTRASSTTPLPVIGPRGVERIVDGFNAAYATDNWYRIAHHGERVVPPSGAGARAFAFDLPVSTARVFDRDGLRVTAFRVDHAPISPAVGYRFDYKGRALCVSGDTAKSANLERACRNVDILIHDALQPKLLTLMEAAFAAQGSTNTAAIFHDIQDYHATPEQAAESAATTGARMLVLSHLVPPLPFAYLRAAFLGDAPNRYRGPIVLGADGMMFSLAPKTDTIERSSLM